MASSSSTSASISNGNNRHQLDNLPDLVNDNLFKYLHLDDIWNLRLVSKRFYLIINDLKIIELSFTDYEECKNNWFSTTKRIKLSNQLCALSQLPMIVNPSHHLLNLKYLRIPLYHFRPVKLEDLNKFTKLQILMIKGEDDCFEGCFEGSINLPNLKALSIELVNTKPNVTIDAPNLHSLHIFSRNRLAAQLASPDSPTGSNFIGDLIKFKNPLSVKYLTLGDHYKNISIFSNLECLEFNREFNPVVDDLSRFKSLKKLRINSFRSAGIDVLKNLFKLKRDDLEMVLDGIKIKEFNKLDEYKNKRSDLEYQLVNYSELEDDLNFVTYIDYNELVDLLPKNQPSDLFKKYNNIECMRINRRIEDENRLIHFVRECPNLYSLRITGSSLSQQFYDQLPVICSLTDLIINGEDVKLSFKFITKITNLRFFLTDQDVQMDENLNLDNLKHLERFEFKFRNKRKVTIVEIGENEYGLTEFNDVDNSIHYVRNYSSLNEIVQWFNYMR